MFIVAAKAVAEQVRGESGDRADPSVAEQASRDIAACGSAGDECISDEGMARVPRPDDIAAHIWACAYKRGYIAVCPRQSQ
jgi:malate dehydrogenase (oxaloacetate-decarboxylating)(NADP+)